MSGFTFHTSRRLSGKQVDNVGEDKRYSVGNACTDSTEDSIESVKDDTLGRIFCKIYEGREGVEA